jgi:hypothetical protein
LSLLGKLHYLELSTSVVTLFGTRREKLPAWFNTHDWGVKVNYYASQFLPSHVGLIDVAHKSFTIKVSGAARALMECLYLAPEKQELVESYELMEGLNNLKPDAVQELLEQCSSIKVKRLFLYMANKASHQWVEYIDTDKIDLGAGKRSLVPNGMYNAKYQITIPKELDKYGRKVL